MARAHWRDDEKAESLRNEYELYFQLQIGICMFDQGHQVKALLMIGDCRKYRL